MTSTYSITITGIQAGIEKSTAIKQLAELLKVAEEKVASMLDSEKFVVKSGVDLKTTAKYEAALQKCGCNVIVEPEGIADELSFDIPVLPATAAQATSTAHPLFEQATQTQATSIFKTVSSFYENPPRNIDDWRGMSHRNKSLFIATVAIGLCVVFLFINFIQKSKTSGANGDASSLSVSSNSDQQATDALTNRCISQAKSQGYRSGQCAYFFIDACIRTQSRSEMEAVLRTDAMGGIGPARSCPNMPSHYVAEFDKF